MTCTVVDFEKDSMVFKVADCTKDELENKILLFFAAENLSLKSDTEKEKIFQKGNKTLRILLGVFVKYFRLSVAINREDSFFLVALHRDMNIILSGGLAGLKSSRKEFTRITEAFKVNFNS